MLPIEQACYWLAHRAPRQARPLGGATETEIAVVGAGLTGLWTALFLKELAPACEVAVVEQGLAAHGASGRNAGMLSETVDHSHGLAIEHFGQAEARRLARLGETNVAELAAFLEQRRIRCDYEPTGRLMVALTERQLKEARRTVGIAESLELDSFRYLDRQAVRAELDSPLYLGGVGVTGGGILDPVKLVDGLREVAERQGVRVYERSRVTAVERRGAGARIRTEGGSLDARRVVLATSAYTHHLLPDLTRRFIPIYDYVLVSEPLSADQRAAIGWRRRQGVTDGRASSTTTGLQRTTGSCGAPARRRITRATGSIGPAIILRLTTRGCGGASSGTSRRSAGSSFPMPGAVRSARPRGLLPSSDWPWRDASCMAWGTPATASARPDWQGGSWPTWRSTGRASSSISRWFAGSRFPTRLSRSVPGRWPA